MPPKQSTSTPASQVISLGVPQRDDRIGKPRSVHLHAQLEPPGGVRDRPQFVERIHRPHLGRLRQTEHARLGIVNIVPLVDRVVNGLRIDLPVRAGQQEDLRAVGEELRRAALGGFDVRVFVAQDAVIRLAERGEREGIGRRAVEDEEHLAVGLEHIADQVGRLGRPGVVAIAGLVALVGLGHRGKRFRANAGIIVTGKLAAGICFRIHVRILAPRLAEGRRELDPLSTLNDAKEQRLWNAFGCLACLAGNTLLSFNSGSGLVCYYERCGRPRQRRPGSAGWRRG